MNKLIKILLVVSVFIWTFLLSVKLESISAALEYPFTGIINADSLVIREKASNGSKAVTELAYGTRIEVLGSEGGFYKIKYDNDKVAYGLDNYILNIDKNILTSDVEGKETYKDYCDTLGKEGFPSSYCPYLYYLHINYPEWIFKADKTGLDLMEAAKEESDKSVLATNNKNYWTEKGSHEGLFHYVNANVNASFLDPRNSLFEPTIFQFLDFSSSKDITSDEASSKISGKGNLSKYFEAFKKAGSDFEVNPLHLMSRSRQEGANDEDYNSVAGKFTTNVSKNNDYKYNKKALGNSLDGYYNYYNIGAWYGDGFSAIGRGIAYAGGFLEKNECYDYKDGIGTYNVKRCGPLSFQRPWNSADKAILGGAQFISELYVKRGQNTNYYEKFNVSSKSTYEDYTHQYMTNLHAPAAESNQLYNAYKAASLLHSKFEFIIPVYENMPSDGIQPVDKSGDSTLTSITVNDKLITGFDKDVVEYSYNVVTNKNVIKVGAKTSSDKASIVGTGDYEFKEGIVDVTIEVTAENGNKSVYKINVKQIIPEENITVNDIVSKLGVKANDTIMYGISPGTNVSTLINSVNKNKGSATIVDKDGKEKKNGVLCTSDKITIKGTIEVKTYIIGVRGDVNGDGKVSIVDLLQIQKDILDRGKLENQRRYAGDVNYDNKISIVDLLLIQKHILGRGNL